MSESSKNSEKTNDIDENEDIVYTHPIVTEKKGYTDLTDYKRNYEDMEARANIQRIKNYTEIESMELKEQDDQLKKRKDDVIVSKSFAHENGKERYAEESKPTTSKITDIKKNGKIDELTNTTKEHGNISMKNTQEMKNGLEDNSNTSELTDISPEEAYVRHMERVIAANALPPKNMEILKDLYTHYKFNKKHASTIEETRVETSMDTPNLGESKTDTHDQIEKAPINDNEKPILNQSLKDSNNVIQSNAQKASKNSAVIESSALDDEKMGSLENTDPFANNNEILTSTPKSSKEKIPASSSLNDDVICDVTSMTIESPFSDFSLQTRKLKTGLRIPKIMKEEDSNVEQKQDNKVISNVIKEKTNEEVSVTGIARNQPDSSSISSNIQYSTSLDVSKNVELSHQQNVLRNKNNELFLTNVDLVCRCPQTEANVISNENNNVESIVDRIRRYFLSLFIDYLVPRQIRNNKTKVSCTSCTKAKVSCI